MKKKRRTFRQTFCSVQTFLELQCLVDDLVEFLELSMFINASLPQVYYLIKWIGDSNMKQKTFGLIPYTCIMCHTMYIVYWKNSYRWSELMACSYTCREKNTVQKKMSMRNWDDRPLYQKSRFFITSRRVGLSLYISHSRKALKCLLQNIYLLLDLLYHKHNPLIITNVEDSIF